MKTNPSPQDRSRDCASHSEAATAVAAALWAAPVIASLIAAWLSLFCATSSAQTADTVAEREVQRRQSAIPQGEAALARGKAAMKAKNFTVAHEEFRTALVYLPDAVVSGKAYDDAVEGFCKSGVILAAARIAQADYAGAEAILNEILSDRYDPNCRPARELLTH
jgi:tetratricopeptide (TPR) repeat protein